MFDQVIDKEKKTKKTPGWDDLPGDGDDLTAAIKSKVDKKKKSKSKSVGGKKK